MRSTAFVLRCFFHVFVILLSLSLIRVVLGVKPITLSYLLHLLSQLDIDFSSVIYKISLIAQDFDFSGDINFWNAVVQILRGLYNMLTLPLEMLFDIFQFVLSVCKFIIALLGFNVFEGVPKA